MATQIAPLRGHDGVESRKDSCDGRGSPTLGKASDGNVAIGLAARRMDLNARKDHFSRAIVRAIAAAAGVGANVPELDQNSEDINFAATDSDDGPGPKLDGQLKASQNIDPSGPSFTFDLNVKNYNDLRWPVETLYVPRILILIHIPPDPSGWMDCDPERIVLRRCAYWVSLAGAPATANTSTVAITVPTDQVFDVDALHNNLRAPGAAL